MGKIGTTPVNMRALKPGMSLKALSKATGIALPHLSRIVNGRRGLTIRTAKLIAKHAKVTVEHVVKVLAA